jgi:hypothetical protein
LSALPEEESMKSHRDKAIRCPFYKGEDPARHVIRCEGVGEAEYLEWGFGNREAERRKQLRIYCGDVQTCQRCETYRMIQESKYD